MVRPKVFTVKSPLGMEDGGEVLRVLGRGLSLPAAPSPLTELWTGGMALHGFLCLACASAFLAGALAGFALPLSTSMLLRKASMRLTTLQGAPV